MENWILEKDALKLFAKHYETGEIIPDELIAKIKDSSALKLFIRNFFITAISL